MFHEFKMAVQAQFNEMTKHPLYRMNIDKDILVGTYLNSFRPEDNPIFRERTKHDCTCCKQFIRAVGDVVTIIDGEIVTIWDVDAHGTIYEPVAKALSQLVNTHEIQDVFLTDRPTAGVDKTQEIFEGDTPIHTWEHFFVEIPSRFVKPKDKIPTLLGKHRDLKHVMLRGIMEFSFDDLNDVLTLINNKQLYRCGETQAKILEEFILLKKAYEGKNMSTNNFGWVMESSTNASVAGLRNTSLGTLLTDLAEGKELNEAVKAYESKVSGGNYMTSTKVVSQSQYKAAGATLEGLGLKTTVHRRHACSTDITVNNVLFADRAAKASMDGNPFDELVKSSAQAPKNLRPAPMPIEAFMAEIIPNCTSLELLLENRHAHHLMSLIAPVYPDAGNMLAWDNNFSWAYNGNTTDSVKERVKKAGGDVTGELRISLSWFNKDDLDLHVIEPGGNEIDFNTKGQTHESGGKLDVDMNYIKIVEDPVENITYETIKRMPPGVYTIRVHNWNRRVNNNPGFDVEIEKQGEVTILHYDSGVREKEYVDVAKLTKDVHGKITIKASIPEGDGTKEIWNISTGQFHRVSMAMLSPNFWDGQMQGNEHYFFILQDCLNPDPALGFHAEYLRPELYEHRKAFNVLSGSMMAPYSDQQLSGLGFASTKRSDITCRVNGKDFYKIIF